MCNFQVCKSVKNKKKRARTNTHILWRVHDYTNQSTIYSYEVILVYYYLFCKSKGGKRTSISAYFAQMEFVAFRLPSPLFADCIHFIVLIPYRNGIIFCFRVWKHVIFRSIFFFLLPMLGLHCVQ